MGRKVSRTVVSGGVLYPAGATVPDEAAGAITADVWAESASRATPKPAEKPASSKAKKG